MLLNDVGSDLRDVAEWYGHGSILLWCANLQGVARQEAPARNRPRALRQLATYHDWRDKGNPGALKPNCPAGRAWPCLIKKIGVSLRMRTESGKGRRLREAPAPRQSPPASQRDAGRGCLP